MSFCVAPSQRFSSPYTSLLNFCEYLKTWVLFFFFCVPISWPLFVAFSIRWPESVRCHINYDSRNTDSTTPAAQHFCPGELPSPPACCYRFGFTTPEKDDYLLLPYRLTFIGALAQKLNLDHDFTQPPMTSIASLVISSDKWSHWLK